MAGVKGRSGGARPRSGPKPKAENAGAKTMASSPADAKPLDVLLAIMRDSTVPVSERRKAAKDAAPYVHERAGAKKPATGDAQDAQAAGDKASSPGWGGLLHGSMQ